MSAACDPAADPVNHPLLASVPLNSVWDFAAVSFGTLASVPG
jgi:hypothetical protein